MSAHETDFLELMVGDYAARSQLQVSPLENLQDLQEVYRLTHDCYVSHQYCPPHPSGLIIHYPYFDHVPQTTTLVAKQRGKIAGSISFTEDGPAGFSIDDDFKSACDVVRASGEKMGTIWRLVVQESERSQRTVVIELMNAMMDLLLRKEIKTVLMAVHPKHQNVYVRMLRAEIVAKAQSTDGLQNAPAVLLRFDPTNLPEGSALGRSRQSNPIPLLILNSPY